MFISQLYPYMIIFVSAYGVVLKPGIFLNDPKSRYPFFNYSYRFLRWWAPCRQEVWIFQLSVGVKASLVESQQMSSFVFISFHRLSFCIHFLPCSLHVAFISFHFAFISFHFAFMSFHVPSLCIKDTGLRKLICSNRSGGYPPKRSRFVFFHILLSFLLSFSYRFGGLCRLPSSGFTNMYMYKLVIVLFTLIVFWAGNVLAVLRCKPS